MKVIVHVHDKSFDRVNHEFMLDKEEKERRYGNESIKTVRKGVFQVANMFEIHHLTLSQFMNFSMGNEAHEIHFDCGPTAYEYQTAINCLLRGTNWKDKRIMVNKDILWPSEHVKDSDKKRFLSLNGAIEVAESHTMTNQEMMERFESFVS